MRNKNEDVAGLIGSLLLLVAVTGFLVAVAYGYVWNIVTLMSDMDTASATEAVVRLLGIVVPPAGAIMGYF